MRNRKETTTVIVHHSLSPDVPMAEVRRWHMTDPDKMFSDVGYHAGIHEDGSRELGRPLSLMGAHAKHRNSKSIGVVLLGDFRKTPPTMEQVFSLIEFVLALNVIYGELKVEWHHSMCPAELFPREVFLRLYNYNLKKGCQNG